MNIGFDIDGVILNQEKFQLKAGTKYFKKKFIKEYYRAMGRNLKMKDVQVYDYATGLLTNKKQLDINKPHISINSKGYGIKDTFKCSEEEEKDFWYKYMIKYALFAPVRKDAKRVIKELREEGNKIYFISARAKANEDNLVGKIQRAIVKAKFMFAGISYDGIEFGSYKEETELSDKVNACKKLDIDIMIEDKKSNAIGIEKVTKAKSFLFASKNNADIKDKNMPRFISFSDLYYGIKNYQDKDYVETLHKAEKALLTKEELETHYKLYRTYHETNIHDANITKKREQNLKTFSKYAKHIFDKKLKYDVINEERMPEEEGVIITTNHRDLLDVAAIIRILEHLTCHGVLKADFLDTFIGDVFTELGFIFVDRNDKFSREQAIEIAVKRVLSKSNIIICPEGTRNKTDDLILPFGYGAVSMAQKSGSPIYPVGIYTVNNHKTINFGEKIEVGIEDDLYLVNKKLECVTKELIIEGMDYFENKQIGYSKSKVKTM